MRGKIEVNPITTALTITSNPPGTPDAIPTSIEGIPLEIQHINATTTRCNFQFNPTNCNKMEVTGTIHSSEGGTDTIGVPFQVTNCAALKFAPKFSVSTCGKTSKANGASLTAKVTYPNAPQGTQANITKVKVELPKQLPSRLTTLQKACTATQFEANPAGCPTESKIGYAVVHTPLLPVPLEGPAIFVSHGGEAFPSLTMVLQGYGVTSTSSARRSSAKPGSRRRRSRRSPTTPSPRFELTLPEGKYSALAANGNLCTDASKLTMPTEFIAPERRGDPRDHEDRRQRLREGQGPHPRPEARQGAEGVQQEAEGQARRVCARSAEEVRSDQAEEDALKGSVATRAASSAPMNGASAKYVARGASSGSSAIRPRWA